MKFDEWAAAMMAELQQAGFPVCLNQGFPFVQTPESLGGKMKFLDWESPTGLPCAKQIYGDGILIMPGPTP